MDYKNSLEGMHLLQSTESPGNGCGNKKGSKSSLQENHPCQSTESPGNSCGNNMDYKSSLEGMQLFQSTESPGNDCGNTKGSKSSLQENHPCQSTEFPGNSCGNDMDYKNSFEGNHLFQSTECPGNSWGNNMDHKSSLEGMQLFQSTERPGNDCGNKKGSKSSLQENHPCQSTEFPGNSCGNDMDYKNSFEGNHLFQSTECPGNSWGNNMDYKSSLEGMHLFQSTESPGNDCGNTKGFKSSLQENHPCQSTESPGNSCGNDMDYKSSFEGNHPFQSTECHGNSCGNNMDYISSLEGMQLFQSTEIPGNDCGNKKGSKSSLQENHPCQSTENPGNGCENNKGSKSSRQEKHPCQSTYERQPEIGITKKQKTKDERESVSAELGSRGSSFIKDAVSTKFNYPKGNKNLGNTCYFNSILQVLYFTQSLEESLDSLEELLEYAKKIEIHNARKRGQFPSKYFPCKTDNFKDFLSKDLLELLKKQRTPYKNKTSINPEGLFQTVKKKNNQFQIGKQMDSFEVFNALIVGIFDEMDFLTKFTEKSTDEIAVNVRDLFTGLSLRVYVYCSCNHVEVDLEKYTSLSIPIVQMTEIKWNSDEQYPVELQTLWKKELESDLERGLAALEQIEEYNGCDLPCPTCKTGGSGKVYRRLLLFQPPLVLVLRIDRFRMNQNNKLAKNDDRVEYPRTLDLSTFCSVATRYAEPQIHDPNDEPKNDYKYELYAVVVHSGTVSGGHYYAFVNTTRKQVINRWKYFVSKRTKSENSEETLKEEVESIFKERKNEIKQTEKVINPNKELDKPEVTPNWFCVNDETVYPVEQDKALRRKDAYLLFYEAQ